MRDPQSCPTVLIAEDECLFASLLEAWIEDRKMKPLGPVTSIQDARDLLEEFGKPDAAILDIDLHGETIFPHCRNLTGPPGSLHICDRLRFYPASPFSGHSYTLKAHHGTQCSTLAATDHAEGSRRFFIDQLNCRSRLLVRFGAQLMPRRFNAFRGRSHQTLAIKG